MVVNSNRVKNPNGVPNKGKRFDHSSSKRVGARDKHVHTVGRSCGYYPEPLRCPRDVRVYEVPPGVGETSRASAATCPRSNASTPGDQPSDSELVV